MFAVRFIESPEKEWVQWDFEAKATAEAVFDDLVKNSSFMKIALVIDGGAILKLEDRTD